VHQRFLAFLFGDCFYVIVNFFSENIGGSYEEMAVENEESCSVPKMNIVQQRKKLGA